MKLITPYNENIKTSNTNFAIGCTYAYSTTFFAPLQPQKCCIVCKIEWYTLLALVLEPALKLKLARSGVVMGAGVLNKSIRFIRWLLPAWFPKPSFKVRSTTFLASFLSWEHPFDPVAWWNLWESMSVRSLLSAKTTNQAHEKLSDSFFDI